MSERAPLRALAEWAGIARSYIGYDGRPVEVTDATCEILLRAVGFDASSEAEAARLLDANAGASIRAALDPVRVVRAGSPELAGESVFWGSLVRQLPSEIGEALALARQGEGALYYSVVPALS